MILRVLGDITINVVVTLLERAYETTLQQPKPNQELSWKILKNKNIRWICTKHEPETTKSGQSSSVTLTKSQYIFKTEFMHEKHNFYLFNVLSHAL